MELAWAGTAVSESRRVRPPVCRSRSRLFREASSCWVDPPGWIGWHLVDATHRWLVLSVCSLLFPFRRLSACEPLTRRVIASSLFVAPVSYSRLYHPRLQHPPAPSSCSLTTRALARRIVLFGTLCRSLACEPAFDQLPRFVSFMSPFTPFFHV